MKMYEISEALEALIDSETGEIADFEAFEALQMEKTKKIENICCAIKNLKSNAKGIKEERDKLYKRQKAAENKATKLMEYLELCLGGETFESPRAKVIYKSSQSVAIDDGFVEWAENNADEFLKYKEPEIDKTAIRDAIESGREIPFTRLESKSNINIK